MDDYWEKKVKEVVKISKEYGYEELNNEFWRHKPAILCSLVIDIYKSKDKTVESLEERVKRTIKEDLDASRN